MIYLKIWSVSGFGIQQRWATSSGYPGSSTGRCQDRRRASKSLHCSDEQIRERHWQIRLSQRALCKCFNNGLWKTLNIRLFVQERNERLFFRVLASDIGNMMPLVYTPTVGLGCQLFSLLFQHPRGLFITIHDKGHIYDILRVSAPCSGDIAIDLNYFDLSLELAWNRCSCHCCHRRRTHFRTWRFGCQRNGHSCG